MNISNLAAEVLRQAQKPPMSLLELLIAFEEAGCSGPWRDGTNLILVHPPGQPPSGQLAAALTYWEPELLRRVRLFPARYQKLLSAIVH